MNRNLSLCTLAVLASLAAGAQAQSLANGDFSADLAGWQVIGDASVQAAALAATPLWLTTASADFEDDFPLIAGALNRSGNAAAAVGTLDGVEAFVGLPIGALDPDAPNGLAAYEGSAARQTFSAAAGDTLSFRWNFGTSDSFEDYAFVVVDGQFSRLAGPVDAILPGTFGNGLQTGEQTFSLNLVGNGTHTLAFGVVDVGDYNLTSTLAVGQVLVTAVPEPAGLALLVAGLGLLGGVARRRTRA